MLRLPFLLVFLAHIPAYSYVTDSPSFSERLDKLYEKLENLTLTPVQPVSQSPENKLYAKLELLNSLTPDRVDISDDDDELLSAMQQWGLVDPGQLEVMVKELEKVRDEKSEKMLDGEYADGEWVDGDLQDLDYANDANEEWDDIEPDSSTVKPLSLARPDPGYREEVISAADAIAATNERPRILDDSSMSLKEQTALRQAAYAHMRNMVRASKCLTPQPRWLNVRQLAPAADTMYMPPCVELHRCAPDSGCCYNEDQVCAPVEGKYVTLSLYLTKADGNVSPSRMLFFNHTRCACVSRDTLQTTVRTRSVHNYRVERVNPAAKETAIVSSTSASKEKEEWRSTEEPRLERDEEPTSPPQLRRCTCPALFIARISDAGDCSCVCKWPEPHRRRDCLSLAQGREHFGLRDRVCVNHGDCTPPSCEYGNYEKKLGRCPQRR
ncbi:uncharacterized protein LOC113226371 isoform X2 [Hyposmocoma kahamanoa]|nr:uncharacterized protein LOC113226371 isoform X2 [Hyposmocoma kahamanoa]